MTWEDLRESKLWKVFSDISTFAWLTGITSSAVSSVEAGMHGKPVELILLYASVSGASVTFLVERAAALLRRRKSPPVKTSLQENQIDQDKLVEVVKGFIGLHPDGSTMIVLLDLIVPKPSHRQISSWSLYLTHPSGEVMIPARHRQMGYGFHFRVASKTNPTTGFDIVRAKPIDPDFPREGYVCFEIPGAGEFFDRIFGAVFQVHAHGASSFPLLSSQPLPAGRWLRRTEQFAGNYEFPTADF
jgi:hypothetical protein